MHPDIHTSDIHCLSHRLLPITAVCFPPCPLSCPAGRAEWSWKDRGWVVSWVRSESCKDRGRQGFTQSNPDPSAASERFRPLWPWSLTSRSWPAHSRDISPRGFSHPALLNLGCSSACSHRRQTLHSYISVTFSLPGKSKPLLKGYCSREALPSPQLQSVPCSLAFLSFLTWFYVFCFPKCDHPSLLSQRLCPTCWYLYVTPGYIFTGLGQGKVLRLWPLWIQLHQKLQHRFRASRRAQ